jgi:hypothetical protein
VYVEHVKSLNSKNAKFFEYFAVIMWNTLTEEGRLSVKVTPALWVLLHQEPRRPPSRRI